MEEKLFDLIFVGQRNIFLSGSAGCGKSYLLRIIHQRAKELSMRCMLTATTGIAAVTVGGSTFHSWSGIKKGDGTAEALYALVSSNRLAMLRWRFTKLLLVDEISMFGAELMDKINYVAQKIRGNREPWGGIQVVFSGDMLQLPPVNSRFAFHAKAWPAFEFIPIFLTKPYRYVDLSFFHMLLRIRSGIPMEQDLHRLEQRFCAYKNLQKQEIEPTRLYALKRDVESYNHEHLLQLPGKSAPFSVHDRAFLLRNDTRVPVDSYDLTQFQALLNQAVPEYIELKVGAQVMLLANLDTENGLCNGSRGVIFDIIADKGVLVKFLNDETILVTYHTWEFIREEERGTILITRTQIPLILAWALTVHRTQGLTLDYVIADLGPSIFTAGQAYVALSRCRSLEGLFLSNFRPESIQANDEALAFEETLRAYDVLVLRCPNHLSKEIVV